MTHGQRGGGHSFRVRSMSEDAWHVVHVPARGHVICSCAGVDWCSHIDATLVAGERAMVPRAEWAEANRAQIAARGRIGAPKTWQAHWRGNRRWRGLPPARITTLDRSREEGRPMMCLEGRGGERRLVQEVSEKAGWIITREPVKGCIFHVAPDQDTQSRAAEAARAAGIPIASYAEWVGVAEKLGQMFSHEIAARVATNNLQDGIDKG